MEIIEQKYTKNAENPTKWRGENLLGFALMQVRDKINKEM